MLHYTYNDEELNLSTKSLSDGDWHRLEVTWIGTEIKLSVDYGKYYAVLPFTLKIQGLYVGKILIGGPDNTYSSLSAGYNYLEGKSYSVLESSIYNSLLCLGCIQDVRIGNHQTTLNRPTVKENVLDGCPSLMDCQSDCPSNSECVIDWGDSHCECKKGHVGSLCTSICNVSPCEENGVCLEDFGTSKGYNCQCNSSEYSGKTTKSFQLLRLNNLQYFRHLL
jgi:cadherin EGF LAG seven-pass G-type receptor 1